MDLILMQTNSRYLAASHTLLRYSTIIHNTRNQQPS